MQEVWMPGELRVEVLLTAADTGGAFCLLSDHPRPGWSLPPHRHLNEAETIYVVSGDFAFEVGGQTLEVGAGGVAHIPAGVVHGGAITSQHEGHRMLIFSPAGMEEFFLAAGSPSADVAPDLGRLVELATEHGWRFETGTS